MDRDRLLCKVGAAHALLLVTLLAALQAAGLPVRGALLGGGLIGFSFLSFWGIAGSIAAGNRRGLGLALTAIKILAYFVLMAAILTGQLSADGEGFALGVSCFVIATVVVALTRRAPQTAART